MENNHTSAREGKDPPFLTEERRKGIKALFPWANWAALDGAGATYLSEKKPEEDPLSLGWTHRNCFGGTLGYLDDTPRVNWRDSIINLNEPIK